MCPVCFTHSVMYRLNDVIIFLYHIISLCFPFHYIRYLPKRLYYFIVFSLKKYDTFQGCSGNYGNCTSYTSLILFSLKHSNCIPTGKTMYITESHIPAYDKHQLAYTAAYSDTKHRLPVLHSVSPAPTANPLYNNQNMHNHYNTIVYYPCHHQNKFSNNTGPFPADD